MKIIVVTNQAGIGRGYYKHRDFDVLSNYMHERFMDNGVMVEDIFCCPFHPQFGTGTYKQESYDRKPNPGMLIKACSKHNINPKLSMMIGDRKSDQDAAFRAGVLIYIDSRSTDWIRRSIYRIEYA